MGCMHTLLTLFGYYTLPQLAQITAIESVTRHGNLHVTKITLFPHYIVLLLKLSLKVKRLKVSTFIYRHLQGNPDQQQFTVRIKWRTDQQCLLIFFHSLIIPNLQCAI